MLNAEDSSSCSEISEQVPKQLSSKLKEDPSYNLLFKFSIKISSEKNFNYNVYFLNFPTLQVTENNEGSIIFPMSVDELSSHTSPALEIDAFQNGIEMGSASLIVSECVYRICQKIETDAKYPIECNLQKPLWLIKKNRRETEIDVNFKLDCIGQTMIQDIKEIKEIVKEPELEVDEYCAELNGHTLNIKMLRRPRPQDKDDYLDDSNREIIRNNSQIMFQMPSNQGLCNKSPQNAYMYNVGTCRQGQHGHDADKIKVLPGKSAVEDGHSKDTFVIKLGKKAHDADGKSRLELELKAPKPVGPDDFKKPSREASTQTDSAATGKKRKKGKGKNKKGKKGNKK